MEETFETCSELISPETEKQWNIVNHINQGKIRRTSSPDNITPQKRQQSSTVITEDLEVKNPKKKLISDLNTSLTLSLQVCTLSLEESSAFDSPDLSNLLPWIQNKMGKNKVTQSNITEQKSEKLNREEAAGIKRRNSTGSKVDTKTEIMEVTLPMVSGVKTRRNSIGSTSRTVKPAYRQQKDIAVKGKQQEQISDKKKGDTSQKPVEQKKEVVNDGKQTQEELGMVSACNQGQSIDKEFLINVLDIFRKDMKDSLKGS